MALNQTDEQLLLPSVTFGLRNLQTNSRSCCGQEVEKIRPVRGQNYIFSGSVPQPAHCEFPRPNTQISLHINPSLSLR